MIKQNHVVIKSDGFSNGTHIFIDGVELVSVTHLRLEIGVSETMQATLTMRVYIDELEVEGALAVERASVTPGPSAYENVSEQHRMSDLEALERAMTLIGDADGRAVLEAMIQAIADRAKR